MKLVFPTVYSQWGYVSYGNGGQVVGIIYPVAFGHQDQVIMTPSLNSYVNSVPSCTRVGGNLAGCSVVCSDYAVNISWIAIGF